MVRKGQCERSSSERSRWVWGHVSWTAGHTDQDRYRSIHSMVTTEAILKAALSTPGITPSLHRSCWQQKNSKLSNWKNSAISFMLHWDVFQQEEVLNLPKKKKKETNKKKKILLKEIPFWYGENHCPDCHILAF